MSTPHSARFEPKEGDQLGRKKIKISRITSQKSRQVTFNKRKVGLMKKAMELSILCDCELAVILFDHRKQLYQYSTLSAPNGMETLIQRWKDYDGSYEALTNADLQTLKPGRAASFRVGKKRKGSNGKSLPVEETKLTKSGSRSSKYDEDEDEDDEDEDDEDEDDDEDDDKSTKLSKSQSTRSSMKHTNTHPLQSPSTAAGPANDYSKQMISLPSLPTIGNPQPVPSINPTHSMLTPSIGGHSYASMLSPSNLPSASSIGASGFGSSYAFNTPNSSSTLQQVLNSQTSLLTPPASTASHPNIFASGMSPSQIHPMLTQNRINDAQQLQQPYPSAPYGDMSKMLHGQSHPSIHSQYRPPSAQTGGMIPPSPTSMALFNQPMPSPPYNNNPYNMYLSQQHPMHPSQHHLNSSLNPQYHSIHSQQPPYPPHASSIKTPSPLSARAGVGASYANLSMPPSQPMANTSSSLSHSQSSQSLGASSLASDAGPSSSAGEPSSQSAPPPVGTAIPQPAPNPSSTIARATTPSSSPPSSNSPNPSPANGTTNATTTSSSLLSKRAPFKATLSLEIPTKPTGDSSVTIAIDPSTNNPNEEEKSGVDITENTSAAIEASNPSDPKSELTATSNTQSSMAAPNVATAANPSNLNGQSNPTLPIRPTHPPYLHSHSVPVSAPANSMVDNSMPMAMSNANHPMSAFAGMPMGYSPLTSPSTYMSSDSAAMMFAVNGGMNGMALTTPGAPHPSASNPTATGATSALANGAMGHPSMMHPPHGHPPNPYLQPPSPYGQWAASYAHSMDGPSKIYSPTALRSPAVAASLFSRSYQ